MSNNPQYVLPIGICVSVAHGSTPCPQRNSVESNVSGNSRVYALDCTQEGFAICGSANVLENDISNEDQYTITPIACDDVVTCWQLDPITDEVLIEDTVLNEQIVGTITLGFLGFWLFREEF